MNNLGNRNFGLPLPLSQSNPYQLSARSALKAEVSVPEGPLAGVGDIFQPWFEALSFWLRQHGYVIYFQRQLAPIAKYKPAVADYVAQRALALPLRSFDALQVPPSLDAICAHLQATAADHPQMYDWCTFLEEHLPTEDLARLVGKYPCLALGN